MDRYPTQEPSLDLIDLLIQEHLDLNRPRLERFWNYYRNTPSSMPGSDGRPVPAQAMGLPARLREPHLDLNDPRRREVVIENDIAWRIHALNEFLFGKPLPITSLAEDPERAALLTTYLRTTLERSGGTNLFQTLGLLGSVYGTIDLLVRVDEGLGQVVIEPIEAVRAIPVLAEDDYRHFDAYLIHQSTLRNTVASTGLWRRRARRAAGENTLVFTPHAIRRYDGRPTSRTLIAEQPNRLHRVPVVHIQNLSQPFRYEGLSDVEPLIPLQDELNTRLSDRANRVTFQCFKMYLGKGLEHFTDRPIAPGQMWATDNIEASIQAFGGDSDTPSERDHIQEVRDALDKTSGVTPVVAGLLRDKLGNLTSAAALRVTLMGMIARTEQKRLTYGCGIEQLCELILHAADAHGLLPNRPDERRVRLDWPSPLPDSEAERVDLALKKKSLGVDPSRLLRELGYEPRDLAPETQP